MLTHIRPWNPLAELESFGRELERAFGAAEPAGRPHGRWNIYAGDDGVTLTAELPGYDPERFAIEVVGEHLKIAGGRTVARGEGDRAVLNERRDESFEETLAL
ncbi:MAG: Hsp20/alpha crystallin family protein, partial [Planctomycetota bacterium]